MNSNRWAVIVAGALVLAAIVGAIAYNVGVTQGLEETGRAYPYHWHRPWGFGFFFTPLIFFAFWLVVFRGFWRGGWACRGGHGLEEWHRREHERMWNGENDSRRG